MTVQDASMVDGTLAVYLTLEDVSGQDRLAEGADFYHSYQVNKPDKLQKLLISCSVHTDTSVLLIMPGTFREFILRTS